MEAAAWPGRAVPQGTGDNPVYTFALIRPNLRRATRRFSANAPDSFSRRRAPKQFLARAGCPGPGAGHSEKPIRRNKSTNLGSALSGSKAFNCFNQMAQLECRRYAFSSHSNALSLSPRPT